MSGTPGSHDQITETKQLLGIHMMSWRSVDERIGEDPNEKRRSAMVYSRWATNDGVDERATGDGRRGAASRDGCLPQHVSFDTSAGTLSHQHSLQGSS